MKISEEILAKMHEILLKITWHSRKSYVKFAKKLAYFVKSYVEISKITWNFLKNE